LKLSADPIYLISIDLTPKDVSFTFLIITLLILPTKSAVKISLNLPELNPWSESTVVKLLPWLP